MTNEADDRARSKIDEQCIPEEDVVSSFHTPKHTMWRQGSKHYVLTSQDSIDVFHDAPSYLPTEVPLEDSCDGPLNGKEPRVRHKSSGPSFDCRKVALVHPDFKAKDRRIPVLTENEPETTRETTKNARLYHQIPPTQDANTETDELGESWRRNYVPYVPSDVNLLPELQPLNGAPSHKIKNNETDVTYYMPDQDHKTLLSKIKGEFALRNFKFNHSQPHLFITSQWQQQSEMCCMYFAYRLFWAIYFLMWSIWSWVGFGGYSAPSKVKGFYLLYLTDWSIWLLAADTLLQAINVAFHMRKIAFEGRARYLTMKTSLKLSWIISNFTSTIHVFITIMFWTAIYSKDTHSISAITINTRIVPCAYVIFDTFLSATPKRVFHAYLPMILLTIYGIVTDIYYLAGGTTLDGHVAIYPILDWSQPLKTLLFGSGLILIVIPLIHVALCILSGLRTKLWKDLSHHRYEAIHKDDFMMLDAKV